MSVCANRLSSQNYFYPAAAIQDVAKIRAQDCQRLVPPRSTIRSGESVPSPNERRFPALFPQHAREYNLCLFHYAGYAFFIPRLPHLDPGLFRPLKVHCMLMITLPSEENDGLACLFYVDQGQRKSKPRPNRRSL